jgi:hypothetical protein
MSLESDLYAQLSGSAGLTALVSDRIWPSYAADGTATPYVVYSPIFDGAIYFLEGTSDETRARVQIDCYAEDPDTAAAVALAVIAAIPQTGDIHRAAHFNQDLGIEPGTRLYRRLLEFSIFHRSA